MGKKSYNGKRYKKIRIYVKISSYSRIKFNGMDIDFVGVISTPAVAHITKTKGADAGIMISASHNPAKDNGLKVFGPNGINFQMKQRQKLKD